MSKSILQASFLHLMVLSGFDSSNPALEWSYISLCTSSLSVQNERSLTVYECVVCSASLW